MQGKNTDFFSGISWSAFERLSVQGIQFAVFVFMARALTPTDYGLVGMLGFFIVIAQLMAEGGLSQAIIRKLNRTETDCSTAFWVNLAAATALYGLLCAGAPLISRFYGEPRLTALLRVLALAVVIQATLVVHRAVLTAELDFKTQAKSTLVGALVSGLTGLYMAYRGLGAWALVGLQLTNQLATGITLWIVSPWRPGLVFSRASFRNLFGFGSKLLMSNVVESIYQSIYTMTIGKVFSAYALGCYGNARQLGSISSENLTRIVQRAAYTLFCTIRSDREHLRTTIRSYMKLAAFFIFPLMLGLAALAEPLTIALIGHQWIYTARLLRILCLSFLLFPLNAINLMILEILGQGGTYLRLQLFNILCGLALLAAMLPLGLSAVCCGLFAASLAGYTAGATAGGGRIGLGFYRQVRAVFPILLNSAVMAGIMYALRFIIHGEWAQIALGSLIGLTVYTGLSVAFQTDTCRMILRLVHRPDDTQETSRP